MTRCDLSDLPVDQCACRIHGPKEPPAPTGDVVARTDARYPGHCRACGDDYGIGDRIALTHGTWIHETCTDDA